MSDFYNRSRQPSQTPVGTGPCNTPFKIAPKKSSSRPPPSPRQPKNGRASHPKSCSSFPTPSTGEILPPTDPKEPANESVSSAASIPSNASTTFLRPYPSSTSPLRSTSMVKAPSTTTFNPEFKSST